MFPRVDRKAATFLVLACLPAACDRKPAPPMPAAALQRVVHYAAFAPARAAALPGHSWFTAGAAQAAALNLAYSHHVGLEVSGGAIAAHFAAARDRCLNTPALHCILLRADFSTVPDFGAAPGTPPLHEGNLALRLPHDQIASYAADLTTPLPGEAPGTVTVVRQSMTAEDLSQPVADIGQRVAQLQAYLASLKALGDRLTIGVGDLVKIAGETAQTQTEIEAAQAEQRSLAQRVNTEELDVAFTQPAPPPPTPDPIADSFSGARETFTRNVALALDTAIAALPWTPLALLGLALLWLLRVVLFGKRRT